MADASDPRLIRIPGPHAGGSTWDECGLLNQDATLSTPVGDSVELLLPADPAGSFGLACKDGSIGRLTLPRGIAIDHRLRVYLLDAAGGRVLRNDPAAAGYDPAHPFAPLHGVGNDDLDTADLRRLADPVAIAVDRHSLYVADGGTYRVLIYGLDGFTLQDEWRFRSPDRPRDVIATGDRVFILAPDAVYAYRAGDTLPRLLFRRRDVGGAWSRAAVDASGLLYILVPPWLGDPARLQVFDPARPGVRLAEITDPAQVRDRFPFPAVYSIPDESLSQPRYVLPEPLARGCGRTWPKPIPGRTTEVSLTKFPGASGKPGDGFVFDPHGEVVPPAKLRPARTPLYKTGGQPSRSGQPVLNPDMNGVWISQPLESGLFRCRWDTAVLEFADLPAGCAATVQTYTAEERLADQDIQQLPEEAWIDGLTVTGTNRNPAVDPRVQTDFLIDGPPGRFLWLRVRLRGDGFGTPSLSRITLRCPRQSYLEYLPAVFSEDDQSRRFLERLLAVFQAEWDPLEERVASAAGLFDPAAVPPTHLDFLAGWFGVKFENGWSAAARRRLLRMLPDMLFAPRRADGRPGGSRRGTPAALREFVAAVLPTVAGDDDLDTSAFPLVIEGFRERDYRQLVAACAKGSTEALPANDASGPIGAAAGPTPELFGPEEVGRFQLGLTSTLGEEQLLPANAPDLDLFAIHANRFRVVVPEAWVPTPAAKAALCRVIEAEKPAHTAYRLDLVGPRFQVGVRSTVGVDTILAGPEPLRLGDPALPGAVLGPPAASAAGPVQLQPGARLGVDAVRL
jgi:phage tail-like protein